MSLEMYLFKCNKDAYRSGDHGTVVAAFKNGLRTFWSEEPEVSPTMVYWSHANQVFRWFLEHTDAHLVNNDYVEINEHEIISLLNTCNMVLKTGVNNNGNPNQSVCEKVLPIMEETCFGETEYDEDYVETVKWTFERVLALFESVDFENEVLLFDSWW